MVDVEPVVEKPMAEINPIDLSKRPDLQKKRILQLTDRYPGLKAGAITPKLLMATDQQLDELERKVRNDFGFKLEEVRFLTRYKPTFLFN